MPDATLGVISLDVEVEDDKLRPLFSDESGYLSDAELVVDDSF